MARPKRPTTASSASLDAAVRSGAGLPEAKKPRFDARNPHALAPDGRDDEADVFLEVDEGAIGKRRVQRNAVELEGYETDSSEEGFDATRKRWEDEKKGKGKAEEEEDDDDMFGGGGGEEKAVGNGGGKKKKKVEFLDIEEIEGQDFESKREFEDIIDEDKGVGSGTSDSEEDVMDTTADLDAEVGAGGKKKHAPKLDAFNMKSEMEEGQFDSTGNFIRKATEADAIHDSWLQGVSRKDMKRAKEAMDKRDAEARERMKADDALLTSEVLSTLIGCLDRGESVLEAIARLGGGRKKAVNKNKNQWRQKKKAATEDAMEVAKGKESEDPAETRRKEAVEKITGAADVLLTRGQLEIYDETKESLMRQYRRETGDDWVAPKKEGEDTLEVDFTSKQWEYRWTDGRDGDAIYGPYGNTEMKAWNEHGFFGEEVEFREKDGLGEWTRAPNFG